MTLKAEVSKYQEDLVRSVQELVQIKSVHEQPLPGKPFGDGVDKALGYVLSLAESMGFSTKNLDGYCGYAEYGEGELYIGVLSHVDICPEGEMWGVPPYGGMILNNRIYGRGSLDNKGPLLAALYALKAVKDSGKKLNKKIRLIVGTDEQRYYRDMEHYLSQEKPPIAGFTLDGQFPVVFAEKGLAMVEFSSEIPQEREEYIQYIRGGTMENTVPGHCEALLITPRKSEIVRELSEFSKEHRHNMHAKILENGVLLEAFGMETHSISLEQGVNAVSAMLDFLDSLAFGSREMCRTIHFLRTRIGFEIYGDSLGIAYADEFSGRLTVNLGILTFDGKKMHVRLDLRYPVTCRYDQVYGKLQDSFLENGFSPVENSYWDPTYFPREHFLIKALLKAYQKVTKDKSEPTYSGSGSYSKSIPNIAAFGAIFPGESLAWHQKNEYIDIDSLVKTCRIYAEAIYELGSL